jgi:hypothetical protein
MSMRREPSEMKQRRLAAANAVGPAGVGASTPTGENPVKLSMDDLTGPEQAVARLGLEPDALQPIGWLNEAHHKSLIKQNAIGDDLARQIEAHRVVTAASSSGPTA